MVLSFILLLSWGIRLEFHYIIFSTSWLFQICLCDWISLWCMYSMYSHSVLFHGSQQMVEPFGECLAVGEYLGRVDSCGGRRALRNASRLFWCRKYLFEHFYSTDCFQCTYSHGKNKILLLPVVVYFVYLDNGLLIIRFYLDKPLF